MKKPKMMMKSKVKAAERPQGKPMGRASGINKPMEKASVPQVVMENRYGLKGQWDKS